MAKLFILRLRGPRDRERTGTMGEAVKCSVRMEVVVPGVVMVAAGLVTELVGIRPGIDPYPVWMILTGFLVALLGLIRAGAPGFRAVMALLSTLMGLMLLEVLAGLFLRTNQARAFDWEDHLVDDEALVYRLKPNVMDHDENGWRNPEALDRATIVSFGDSQTWGWGRSVSREDAWPLVLGRLTGESVYNLALPGYGPAEYASLLRTDALPLSPRIAVVGLYFGNDIFNSGFLAYLKPHYEALRDDAVDAEALIKSADVITTAANKDKTRWEDQKSERTVLSWMRDRTRIGRLLVQRGLLLPSSPERVYAALPKDSPQRYDACILGRTGIYLNPTSRALALNPSYIVVQEGHRLTRVFFEQMLADAREHGVELVVVFIPTKELVFAELVEQQQGQLSDDYAQLVALESQARADYQAWFEAIGIPVVDGLAPFREALASQSVIYPPLDAHPNKAGYALLARCVADRISSVPEPATNATP